ncbi:hypothetical protein EDD36DRAFT_290327 [Exophiala viscosa]|uniref:Uncharacterized protein n=1 Tax=Exophiala viscosa TaxID=2486360 RepID=A0AAN6IBN9_9EURO|nr:hypothetical protein EDD36DRAFT_290327 [Exophiala viscosa]
MALSCLLLFARNVHQSFSGIGTAAVLFIDFWDVAWRWKILGRSARFPARRRARKRCFTMFSPRYYAGQELQKGA